MQLSAFADLESATWDVAVDGRWLGAGPGDHPVITFPQFDLADLGSVRLIAVWLESGETYTLTALRPSGAKGQDKDAITVTLPEAGAETTTTPEGTPDGPAAVATALQVFDPRLSTEYSATGVPQRFGIELWLSEDPEGEQHPLRLGGEAGRAGQPLSDGPLTVHPMLAHSANLTGLGLYLLVRA